MNTNNLQILEALETVAQAFPWDTVEAQINRTPEGEYQFHFWLPGNEKYGLNYALGSGDTVQEAAARIIEQQAGKRDPDLQRKLKIADLREQIAKLEAVVIGLPPYKPGRELAQINLPKVKGDILV